MRVVVGKPGDELIIGPNVVVSLIDMRGGEMHLGVEAPEDWSVQVVHPELAAAESAAGLDDSALAESRFFPECA